MKPTRSLPAALRDRYLAEGWWTDETLAAWLVRAVEAATAREFVIHSERRPSRRRFDALLEEAQRLHAALHARGLRPGDVVAYQLPNWSEAVTCLFATALGGYVAAPIVHIYGRKEVSFILEKSGARAYVSADAFGHVDYNAIVDETAAGLEALEVHVVVGGDAPGRAARPERVAWDAFVDIAARREAARVDPDEVCVLAYTSGTTSDPKGVLHTHRTLLAEMQHITGMSAIAGPTLMGSPVSHATGMLGGVLLPLAKGVDAHLIDRWDPGRVLAIIDEEGVEAGAGAPFFLSSLLEHPDLAANHLRAIGKTGMGGAPIPPAFCDFAASRGVTVMRSFGATEHPSISASAYDAPERQRHTTDGVPMPGVEVRIVDEEGRDVADGVPGEVWSRGPDLCAGYSDASQNADAFTPQGWFRTGDLAVRSANGAIAITDRLKDVIIRGGENLSAGEIEEAVLELPEVAEVAVVAAPDARLGERAHAFVRLHAAQAEALPLERVQQHLEARGLARQKWPEAVECVADFPRTGSGKIRKVELRAQLREGAAS